MSLLKRAWSFIVGLGIPLDMLLSLVVAPGWLVVMAVATGDARGAVYGLAVMVLPLALIWFREPLSEFTGSFGFHQISAGAPPGMIGFFGWLGLIAVIWMSARDVFQ